MYMTKADNTKGENRQAPPTLLSDQGYSPKESTHDDADSSAEDLLIGTSLSAAGSSSIMVRLPARAFAVDEDESEDESAYFTSEETSVPPQELLQAYKGRNFEHSHGITVSQASSVPSASNLGQGRSVNPHTSNGDLVSHQIDETSYRNGIPIRSTSRNSSVITQPTNVPIPWDEILHSDIPRDIYETSDTGGIRCLTCARWFENFRNFKRHYQQSRRHQEPISSTEHSTSGKDTQNGPPPLIRVPSEDAISSRNTRSSLYETMSTNSRTPGSSVRRQQTKFPCKPCRQVFADITALHSHKSAAVHAHPYYCRSCCIEYVNFEALQTVSFSIRFMRRICATSKASQLR